MKSLRIALFTGVLALAGCDSTYYATMEKFGQHKRDILVSRVENTTESQEEAKEQFASALEQFSSLIQFDGGDLQDQYESSQQHYDDSLAAANEVSANIDSIENVAEDLFDEWQEEIEQYSSQSFKRQSQQKMRETRRNYEAVVKKMRRAEAKMEPVLAAFKDNVLFLKHNLNAQAIGSLKSEYQVIKRDIEALIKEVNASIDNSKQFIDALKADMN
jgi:CRISPR/Cas system CMR-associated protein Cmr5 small subunit